MITSIIIFAFVAAIASTAAFEQEVKTNIFDSVTNSIQTNITQIKASVTDYAASVGKSALSSFTNSLLRGF